MLARRTEAGAAVTELMLRLSTTAESEPSAPPTGCTEALFLSNLPCLLEHPALGVTE